MITPTITPLKKHRGQNGVIAALFVLVAAVIVVWTTHPKPAAPAVDEAPRKLIPAPPPAGAPVEAMKTIAPTPPPGPVSNQITANGVVTFDEQRTSHVFAPVRGWLDKVNVKAAGKRVRAGEVLATMHSVDVYMAELDLIAQVQQFTTQELLSNARRRLQRWSLPPWTMAQIEKSGIASPALPLIAPKNGTLVEHRAIKGLYTEPAEMFTITDPSYVWVIADFAEADAARLEVGTAAKLVIEGLAKPVTAKVAYIYRRVDDGMRKARFELQTPTVVKPGATASVVIDL